MPETPNVDPQAGSGAGGTTTPPASTQAGAPVAGQAAELSKLVRDVLAEELKPIKGEISGLYSRQDKDRNAFSEFMAEFKKQKAKGLSDEDAESAAQGNLAEREKQTRRDQVFDKLAEMYLGPSSPTAAGTGATGTAETARVIEKAGLDANSAEVIELIKQHGSNSVDFALGIGELKARQANKPVSSAAGTTAINAQATSPDKAADIEKGYLAAIAKVPRGNTHAVSQVKAEWRKKARDAGLSLNV